MGAPSQELDHPALDSFDVQAYLRSVTQGGAKRPCLLCGTPHAVQMHSYIQRLVRCPDGRNHQIVIVSIICETAKQAGRQYTKRILPSFVIPECTIRLDLVIQLMEKLAAGDAPVDYDQAYALVGSACERTIDRHLGWARRVLAATVLEAIELLATLAPFGVLPEVSVGVAGLPQLHLTLANLNAARRSAHGAAARPITVICCVHFRYVYERARSPLRISSDQVLRSGCWFDTS